MFQAPPRVLTPGLVQDNRKLPPRRRGAAPEAVSVGPGLVQPAAKHRAAAEALGAPDRSGFRRPPRPPAVTDTARGTERLPKVKVKGPHLRSLGARLGGLRLEQAEHALTVAGSGVLHLQQHAGRAGGLPHGALAGVGGVVAGADGLLGLALGAQLVAQGAPAPAGLEVPQALLPAAARDVLTGLCFWDAMDL